jgi:hypothetical protein
LYVQVRQNNIGKKHHYHLLQKKYAKKPSRLLLLLLLLPLLPLLLLKQVRVHVPPGRSVGRAIARPSGPL